MDVSGETADLLIREGVQATEGALKLSGACLKNVAALLVAISRQDNKVVGKTNARRLARDPASAEVVQLRKEDIPKFQRLAKQYGILYFFVHKRGNENGMTNIVSNQNYATQLNAALEELGYPIPQQAQENTPKKAIPRTPPERFSKEQNSGLKQRAGAANERPSVKGRLETLRAAAESMKDGVTPAREKTR